MTTPPSVEIDLDLAVLDEIKQLRQWVCFKFAWDEKQGRWNKKPLNPHNLRWGAKANDPATWASYNEAVGAVKAHSDMASGIGFEFGNGYMGIDLDHVIHEGGAIEPWADEVVTALDSYTEYSPSGTGLHVIIKTQVPMSSFEPETGKTTHKRKPDNGTELEMYDEGRFFTMTGRPYGELKPIRECTEIAKSLYMRFLHVKEKGQEKQEASPLPSVFVSMSDSELWARCIKSKNGRAIEALCRGDLSRYDGDDSRADLALCSYLAFWTGRDRDRIDRMFRQTALFRPKWDEKHGNDTYGAMTIEKACLSCRDIYTPQVPQEPVVIEKEHLTPETYMTEKSASASLQALIERIKTGEKVPPISTGFETLNRILQGGLRAGLYVLGAVQSLGKTAFVGQIWDSVAATGHDVLIFSLEMAREELITRSISRITYELSKKAVSPGRMAYSTIELLLGSCYGKDGAAGNRRIMDAVEAYSKYSDRIFIFEGVGDITVEQMRDAVKQHIQLTGRRPVVVCDYLQIVKAEPDEAGRRGTDKQANDDNIVALKRLSRDVGIPVIVISSFNRQNYTEPLNAAAFKESGSIEYSADVLIGLQYRGMEYRAGDEKEGQRARRVAALIRRWERYGKEGRPQGIHVKVMKNRAGYKDGAYFTYYPAFNYFACDTDADVEEQKKDEEWARVVDEEGKASRRAGKVF